MVDWRGGRDGKMIFYKRPCFAKSESGTESMPYRAWNQSRSTLGTKCCFGPRCCRYHWICCFEAASQLCMILLPTAARFLSLISTEAMRTCAVKSSLCDVTHFMTRTSMLVGAGLTAVVMTGLVTTGFMKTSLQRNTTLISSTTLMIRIGYC